MKINTIKNIPFKFIGFLKEVHLEVKKVNWPTKEETLKYTLIVIGISAVVAGFLGGMDFIFSKLIERFILS